MNTRDLAHKVLPKTTAMLADFIANTPYEAIPPDVVLSTKRLILDEIVVSAAAWDTPMARALVELKRRQGGTPEATLVVCGQKLPAQSVAYVHAQLANMLDADETLLNRMHTFSASAMAGLAVAEKIGASGQEVIAAVAIGFDITARVGLSLAQFVADGKGGMVFAPLFGWSWMSFGATATVCRLMKLDTKQTARALGQALVTTSVPYDILKYHMKPFWHDGMPANWHRYQACGPMAAAGIDAAILASLGWIAQPDIFDEGSEFWRSLGALGCDYELMYAGLGERWYATDCAIKPYPFCRFGHAALNILSDIVARENVGPEQIREIVVRISPHELSELLMNLVTVDEGLKLMNSLPSALALVALRVPPGPKWFNADLRAPALRELAHKVRHETVPEWGKVLLDQQKADGFFRRIPTEVIVHTTDGRRFSGSADYAIGDPWAPGFEMNDERLADKSHRYLEGILPEARVDALVAAALGLDRARDVAGIANAMAR